MADIVIFPDRFEKQPEAVTVTDVVQRRLDRDAGKLVEYQVHLVHSIIYKKHIVHYIEPVPIDYSDD